MMLEIKNLTVAYGLNNKIKFNSMEIDNQKINVIYGENGCGKSTLLKAINDLIPIDSGNILIDNLVHTKKDSQRKICSFFDKERLFDFLTPKEYFELIVSNYSNKPKKLEKYYETVEKDFNRNWFHGKNSIKSYSDGNRQLIGILCTFFAEPEIILLDEPFNFLDNETKKKLADFIIDYHKEKNTMIILSSNIAMEDYFPVDVLNIIKF